ncbi:DUF4350 domain-containing protein [Rhizomonospora bruguierae]|uniref:DUF4350 domain-containing protein n=1 Tax=Rhizomonospora bruguierae TaxID=1581705 RepID=UPI001BD0C5E5|nr:DUF4350 domain-containing protein [Micromonospora sp. NBRC 107566]
MTLTAPAPPRAAAPRPAAPAPPRRRRRWHRWAIPFGVVLALFATTAIAYSIEQPDPAEAAFLSPVSADAVGGRALADRLAARGIAVRRETRTSDALVAAHAGDTTLFIPAPALVHPYYLRMLRTMPQSTRIVLVEPAGRTLTSAGIWIDVTGQRPAAAAAEPGAGCGLPAAARAGRAAVVRRHYAVRESPSLQPVFACYGDSLVGVRLSAAPLVVVGAADPFRNDRIDEHSNAALATGLLADHPTVVWLDLHRHEPAPGVLDDPDAVDGPPSLAPAPTVARRGEQPSPPPRQEQEKAAGTPNPMWRAFPAWFWALLAQLALAALALALWRARRLGPPVGEPLPVTVRAAETVFGRGRLYRRARDPGATLAMLRRAALRKLAARLEPPPGTGPDDLAALIAGHSGWPADEVRDLLYGPDPDRDEDLVRAAERLAALVHDASAAATAAGPETGGTR